ncbi:hypothetical protein DITRI_Ditri19aG0001900 [Diplodiscus trichospermus]
MATTNQLANVVFKTYGYISKAQAIMFLQDFKLGHYMKIPPKSMFVVQLVGTAWWLLTTVEHILGPLRMFGRLGLYPTMNYFFIIGILAPLPVWLLSRALPAARVVNYWCWDAVDIFFNFYVYRRFKGWWARHNYILLAGLDAGVAFMAILCYFTLQIRDINGPRWQGAQVDDHCPLAS